MLYDVAVVGAGVIGCMIARELSMYKLNICLIEKGNDVSLGASKANSGIVHAGYDALPGSLKAKFNVKGCSLMQRTAEELDVPYKNCGSLVAAFDDEGVKSINELYKRGNENNVKNIELLNASETIKKEPNISKKAKGSLYAKDAGIICPYKLTIAAAENAVTNGADIKLNFDVTNIKKNENEYEYVLQSQDKKIKAKYIINAAGIHSDEIAGMVEDNNFQIIPRRGEYMILDKTEGEQINHVLFQPPSKKGKGILVSPTVDGNILLGPTANKIKHKEDTKTTALRLNEVIKGAKKAMPALNFKKTITSFSGIRATPNTHDFIIRPSLNAEGVFHVAGIESPGLTASPAIAKHTVTMLKNYGITLKKDPASKRRRKGIPNVNEMSFDKRKKFIKQNPSYGKIICRCESISEGEIISSIKRPVGAKTTDGVKRRVRAGMGRCQGGFCLPKVMEILKRELDVSVYDINKSDLKSKIVYNQTGKEV